MLSSKTQFVKSVFTLMSGTTIAQAIPILISPVLTRLYSPVEFASLAVFIVLTTILGLIGTGRYELAVMLPEQEDDAASVVILAGVLLVSACAFYCVLMLFFQAQINYFLHYKFDYLIYWLPLTAFFYGVYQILSYLVNRQRQYYKLAKSAVIQQCVLAVVAISLGFSHQQNGLIIAQVTGQIAGCIALAGQAVSNWYQTVRQTTIARVLQSARLYKQFPSFNVPYSLVGTLSQDFLVVALTAFNQMYVAGLYSLARRVLYAPINFLSASLGQVFYKEAAVGFGNPKLESLTVKLSLTIVALFVPAFVFFAFWAPELFALAFGEKWRAAGTYGVVLIPVAFLFLFASWPERIYEVSQKQHLSFLMQISFSIVAIFVVLVMLYFSVSPLYCIIVFTAITCCYLMTYLAVIFHIAKFNYAGLFAIFKKTLVLVLGATFLLTMVDILPMAGFIKLFISISLVAIYYVRWVLSRGYQNLLVSF